MVTDLEANAAANRISLFGLHDPRQGIVHVVGPEQGLTLPGLLIVCGDSHTSTHGAFGAYAFGIGASEVAHVLMTQTLWQKKPRRMRVTVTGKATAGIGAKDIALSVIARVGAKSATEVLGAYKSVWLGELRRAAERSGLGEISDLVGIPLARDEEN